jgi:2,4'-dihydroxyacetophenone dioxygenase
MGPLLLPSEAMLNTVRVTQGRLQPRDDADGRTRVCEMTRRHPKRRLMDRAAPKPKWHRICISMLVIRSPKDHRHIAAIDVDTVLVSPHLDTRDNETTRQRDNNHYTTSISIMTRPTDTSAVPYQGPPLHGVPDDLVHLNVLDLNNTDERLWVPQSENVWFRPLLFSTSQGYFVNLLRVRKSGILSRHRHAGPVHATTLRGRWHYLEHDWWAEEGSYAFEPPGDIHTLEVPEGVEEMITLFHVTGAYIYVDPMGKPQAVEDVFSKIDLAKAHFEKVGLGADFVNKFIR